MKVSQDARKAFAIKRLPSNQEEKKQQQTAHSEPGRGSYLFEYRFHLIKELIPFNEHFQLFYFVLFTERKEKSENKNRLQGEALIRRERKVWLLILITSADALFPFSFTISERAEKRQENERVSYQKGRV